MNKKFSYILSIHLISAPYCDVLKNTVLRTIKISSNLTFKRLHLSILSEFGLIEDGAHAFFFGKKWANDRSAIFSSIIDNAKLYSSKMKLSSRLYNNLSFLYVFNFGHNWTFSCKVLQELEESTEGYEVMHKEGITPSQYLTE